MITLHQPRADEVTNRPSRHNGGVGPEQPRLAGVAAPEWETGEGPARAPGPRSVRAWLMAAAATVATGLLGLTLVVGAGNDDRRVQPGGPVLGMSVDAIAVSTDFEGRIVALDLDSGRVTRTPIRTGTFVSVDGRLVVQTGCGGWQLLDPTTLTPSRDLIGCGPYHPVGQRGADVNLFARSDRDSAGELLIADGEGGMLAAVLPDVEISTIAAISEARLLIDDGTGQLHWIEPATGASTAYVEGRLIEAGPGGVLWLACDGPAGCEVWFGTADEPRIRRLAVEPSGEVPVARLDDRGTRAVFFEADDALRIVELDGGRERRVENPGIRWSTSTWSPDGRWLLDPQGPVVLALDAIDGRVVRFDGVPGDVSPGWVAVIERP